MLERDSFFAFFPHAQLHGFLAALGDGRAADVAAAGKGHGQLQRMPFPHRVVKDVVSAGIHQINGVATLFGEIVSGFCGRLIAEEPGFRTAIRAMHRYAQGGLF